MPTSVHDPKSLEMLQSWIGKLDLAADWYSLRLVSEKSTLHATRDSRPETNHIDWTKGVMVEVQVDGHSGYAATNVLNFEAVQEVAKKAQHQAKSLAQFAVFKTDDQLRPVHSGQYMSPSSDQRLTTAEIYELLLGAHKTLKTSDKISTTLANIGLIETQFDYVCKNGSALTQVFDMSYTDLAAIAQDGQQTQRRSSNGGVANCFQRGHVNFNSEYLTTQAELVSRQALELIIAENCPTGTMDLVLAPDQMMLQIHESVGHPIELDRILGDERNYAGSSFIKLEDFGQLQYGSPKMNIVFDPTMSGQFASYGFDDSGKKADKEYLIKEGKLLRGLGGAESERRSGVPGAACFRSSSWNRAPIDRMANINLEAGDSSFKEIISSIERGIFMQANRSWSIDDYRNKFQFGCEYGQLIEDGELTKVVKNPNYRGISSPFWNNLHQVGDDSTFEVFGTPYCGKGEPNQVIRVGHASPVCHFKQIEVFGGDA